MSTQSKPIPDQMTVIAITGKGGPDVLTPQMADVPQPGEGQILIRVMAAGVNRPDLLQAKGFYPAPKGHSEIPGLEVAGEVAATAGNVGRFQPGDRVMALVNGGGYGEFCLAEDCATLPIPKAMSFEAAAGVPETFFTVWHNVFERGGLKSGDWFLVHGGSSGIGVTAIQLAKAFGAKVLTTAGSEKKCDACRDLGAVRAINYNSQDFVDVVREETGKRGVAVILDMVGGDYVGRNIRCLAEDGRLVNIGYQQGSKVTVDMMRVMLKRLTLTGSTLRIRPNSVKGRIAKAVEEKILPLLADGRIKVVIDSTFPLQDAGAAHARMETSQHIGKIILTV